MSFLIVWGLVCTHPGLLKPLIRKGFLAFPPVGGLRPEALRLAVFWLILLAQQARCCEPRHVQRAQAVRDVESLREGERLRECGAHTRPVVLVQRVERACLAFGVSFAHQ